MSNGIYIHIPFCRTKCDYCSFYSVPVSDKHVIESYIDSLLKEIDYISSLHGGKDADTVYFGGGTPSILEPRQVEKILKKITDKFDLADSAEITLEMNPDDLHRQNLTGFTKAGVNRIVLGVQSLDNEMRSRIGRRGKSPAESDLELFFSFKGYTRCVDIMAGLPDQNESRLRNDLETLTSYNPEHISLYLLSVDEGTPLGRRFIPDEKFDNLQADLWGFAMDFLEKRGYIHYEISNYALPGFESKHNSKYWDFTSYYGFGSGAHSFVSGKRYSNRLQLADYINSGEFLYEYDTTTAGSRVVEFIMTALRRKNGFSAEEFTIITKISPPENLMSILKSLIIEGLIEADRDRFFLSKKGLYFTDSIIYRLTEPFL